MPISSTCHKTKQALLLLSGGLDSAVSGNILPKNVSVTHALTIDYGQIAARKEILAARRYCRRRKIKHFVIRLPWYKGIKKLSKSAVVQAAPDQLFGKAAHESAHAVWYPQRNLLFISIGAAFAESLGLDAIIAGLNREEGATFPDNSARFIRSAKDVLKKSSFKKLELIMPVASLNKKEIAAKARLSKILPGEIWSCYLDGSNHCLACESCMRLLAASKAARWLEMLKHLKREDQT